MSHEKMCDCDQGRLPCTCKEPDQHQGGPTMARRQFDYDRGFDAGAAERETLRGEVERLRNRMLACKEIAENNAKAFAEALTKLAERDALLVRIAEYAPKGICAPTALQGFAIEAKRMLSASAKPSAPVERDERVELLSHLDRMIGQAEYMLELAENSFDSDVDADDGSFDECREYIEQARAALERKP